LGGGGVHILHVLLPVQYRASDAGPGLTRSLSRDSDSDTLLTGWRTQCRRAGRPGPVLQLSRLGERRRYDGTVRVLGPQNYVVLPCTKGQNWSKSTPRRSMSFPLIPSVDIGNGIRRSPLFKDELMSLPYPEEPLVNTSCTFFGKGFITCLRVTAVKHFFHSSLPETIGDDVRPSVCKTR
jgi:hypothetical protein